MASLKKNYFLFMTRTVLNLIFPLITFPYVCRILGPEGQGQVTYVASIAVLFTMFAQLGIPTYGLRECSKISTNKKLLKQFLVEISIIQLITSIICALGYLFIVFVIIKENLLIFFIYIPQIFLNTFVYDYYYTAIEEQKFITVRYIIVRIVELILLFTFVRGKSALVVYAILMNFIPLMNFVINLIGLKDLSSEKLATLQLRKHLKPVLTIFMATIAVTIYCNLDNVMVGNMVNDEAVGFYGAANKIVRILITIATATSAVLFPRIQQSLQQKNHLLYGKYSKDYICYTLIFSIPAVVGVILLSDGIIFITAGEKYMSAVFSMQLLSPILIIVPIANFFGGMILMANNKEFYYTLSVSIAAIINILSNFLLIPIFKQNGAILGTIIAELVGLVLEILFSKKYVIGIKDSYKNVILYFFSSLIMGFGIFFIKKILHFDIIGLTLISCFISVIVYSICLAIFREQYFLSILCGLKKKIIVGQPREKKKQKEEKKG